jgi:EAL domain-containing protein (putative c-di-GMP-specific phosphodiesterase class I)/DNA-binding NarL/FixJ family response regulator
MPMTTIRVLVAEDDPTLRFALADLLSEEPGLQLVAAAADAEEAISLAALHTPDVALLDVRMPGGGGIRAASQIRSRSPRTRILALSADADRSTVMQMLEAGASGYLVKESPAEEILEGIRTVMGGGGTLSGEVAFGVIDALADHLRRERTESERYSERRSRVRQVLDHGPLRMVYQPIFDLETRAPVGAEALARFDPESGLRPDQWFHEAAEVGLLPELELKAVELALEDLSRMPPGAYLSVNASPGTAASDPFAELLEGVLGDRVVVEITEHAPVDDYEELARSLQELRKAGVRLAVDDAGAGFASLRHILRLAPDILKLDISLTQGIDSDRTRRALASGLIAFAAEVDMGVVAEGIETDAELEALLELGVRDGQGYRLGKPGELPSAGETWRVP